MNENVTYKKPTISYIVHNLSRKNLTKNFLSKATSSYQYLDLVTTPCACSLKTLPGDRTSCGGSLYQCYCIKTVML